ncbi:hypothetical protein QZH41_004254 [Actinostola sp. cb2023]|nr:hypothetical protein QZH41_004254 [Actinostola sp. cb2023]
MAQSFNSTNYSIFSTIVESPESKIAKALALALVALVAVAGNCLVIAAVFQNAKIRTVTNYLIVNMAVADLLYIIIALPPFYLDIFDFYEWTFNSQAKRVYFCKVVHFGQYFFVTVSVLTLAATALDRFFAIALPLRKVFTKKAFYVIVSIIWFVGALVAAPVIYAQKIKKFGDSYYCDEDWGPLFNSTTASRVYTLFLFSVVYCVPFLAMTIMYTIICKKLWQRRIPGEQNRNSCKAMTKSRKKVVKMLIVVVIAFIICWLPVQILSFLWEYEENIKFPPIVNFLCQLLMRAHASMSPCIYAVFSGNYRAGFKKALFYCCGGKNKYIHGDNCSRRATISNAEGRRGTVLLSKQTRLF